MPKPTISLIKIQKDKVKQTPLQLKNNNKSIQRYSSEETFPLSLSPLRSHPVCLSLSIMSLPLVPALILLSTLSSTATSHDSSSSFFSPSSSAPSQSPTLSDWQPARATYYAASDPRDTVGGACGYGDLKRAGYGMATVGLSETLFERGQICGACFQLRCVDDLRWCIPGTSIIVTATNFCAPNYGFTPDGGGRCNPPNKHFVLPIDAFEKIAIWKAGNMPVQYRRYSRNPTLSLSSYNACAC